MLRDVLESYAKMDQVWKREVCVQIAEVNEFILCSREMYSGKRAAKIIGQVFSKCSWLASQAGVNLLDALKASAIQMQSESL